MSFGLCADESIDIVSPLDIPFTSNFMCHIRQGWLTRRMRSMAGAIIGQLTEVTELSFFFKQSAPRFKTEEIIVDSENAVLRG
jgi:hypothetical protein